MSERWRTDPYFVKFLSQDDNWRQIERTMPQIIEIADTGAADSLLTVEHRLARVPNGIRVVKSRVASAGAVTWCTLTADGAWNEKKIFVRFRPANARVLLEVF